MKNHTKVYFDHFYDGDTTVAPICEICFLSEVERQAQDIHHIGGRGSGGSKLLDIPEKLMALCRHHHELCENEAISDESQIADHLEFAEIMGVELDAQIANYTLHQLTQLSKNG